MQLAAAPPFHFPITHSAVLPDPSAYFAPKLLHSPLPTNAFFQNFVLKNGSQPEYIHPYLIKSTLSILSICYPSLFQNTSVVTQIFSPDLSISAANRRQPRHHVVSAFSDLAVTLDHPSTKLRFYLVRGSPFLTCYVKGKTELSISTIHAVKQISCSSGTKCVIKLNNKQNWVLYASSPINLNQVNVSAITTSTFSGIIRIAALPDSDTKTESILDRFSSCYPVSGRAFLNKPFSVEYRWKTRGQGDLLMLAHPLHLELLSNVSDSSLLKNFKYQSIDGGLVGVVGNSWVLKTDPVSVTWHSIGGVKDEASQKEVISALVKDVKGLGNGTSPIATTSSYFYGKQIARAARLALIAEEVCYPDVIPAIKKYLQRTIEPWLDGTFAGNAFLHDSVWGGMMTKAGSVDPAGDFGFGIYNDHHFHLGYFVYAVSVLAKFDPVWGKKYKPQAYSMLSDFMTSEKPNVNSTYTRLRNFDPWKLHSWAAGLTEFPNGRNQESTSEAVNAYYSAALMGLTYGDDNVFDTGSTLLSLEIHAAKRWWHVKEDDSSLYGKKFTKENRVVGILWASQRDSGLWFAPPEWRECRLGIQVLPLLPVTEVLFSDVEYAKELVTWASTVFGRDGVPVADGWKGFIFSLEAIYDQKSALKNLMQLKEHDDGNSLSNLLWWIYSRGGGGGGGKGKNGKVCWSGAP